MDCAMEPLNGAVFLSRMKLKVFIRLFGSTVLGKDSHRHAAPFLIPVLSAPGRRKGCRMNFDQKAFGTRIQQLRASQGMTQEALAEKVNTERSHIAKIEKGLRSCSIALLIDFAGIFHVTTDYLLFGPSLREDQKAADKVKPILFLNLLSKRQIRWRADPSSPRDAVAGIPAMISSAYNDTPAQPQPQAMGAARRDPRGSETLGRDAKSGAVCRPSLGE